MARWSYGYSRFPEYVPVATRRARAAKEAKRLSKKGQALAPVILSGGGRAIARSFWGKAWCDNLESYSDYSNRMPRGRSYVRNGSVLDLQIQPGKVRSQVAGSSLYRIEVTIKPLPPAKWRAISQACSGQIDSLVDLLRGKLSDAVLGVLVDPAQGLFPAPGEISLSCSCPDWADMCKHVAATLYGVGARLDEQPELFFTLRQVDQTELVSAAATLGTATMPESSSARRLDESSLESVFGIEIDTETAPTVPTPAPVPEKAGKRPKRPARTTAKVLPAPAAAPRKAGARAKLPAPPKARTRRTKAQPATLADRVRTFVASARQGDYYESFNVNSRASVRGGRGMDKSEGTEEFIREIGELFKACIDELPGSRAEFESLFELVREIDNDPDSIVFFADEAGSWQLGIDWREVLPAYFVCLSATAHADEYAREVQRALGDFANGDRARLLRDARVVADAEQKRALRARSDRGAARR